jgi:acetyl esterase/lipase
MTQRRLAALAFLFFIAHSFASGQRYHREREPEFSDKPNPCFNANDPNETALWRTNAPGAIGNDPCRDIPYIQAFHAETSSRELRPAILVIPGGGYNQLTDTKEQAPVAEYFASELHVAAFVLRYRLVQKDGAYRYPVPMMDGQRANRLLRARSREFGIDPERIAVFGFSAGGHLASTLALHPDEAFGVLGDDLVDRTSAHVNLLGLGYPVISMNPTVVPPSGSYKHLLFGFDGRELTSLQHHLSGEENVTASMPPVFLFESLDDKTISPQNSVLFANALKRARVPSEVHLFPHGEHGSGLSVGIPEEDAWPSMFANWIAAQWPEQRRVHR